jgi:hypothetical protein
MCNDGVIYRLSEKSQRIKADYNHNEMMTMDSAQSRDRRDSRDRRYFRHVNSCNLYSLRSKRTVGTQSDTHSSHQCAARFSYTDGDRQC